jgi:Spy/CpxP family protein refolding chaperone
MKTFLLFSIVTILAASLHAADGEKTSRAEKADVPRRPGAAGAAGGPVAFERVLTDAQRQQMREFIQAQGADLRESQQKALQLRRELQEAAFSGKADDKFVKQKTDEIAKLDAEQLRIRTLALAKVAASFTDEQKAQVKEMTERVNAARAPLGGGLRGRDGEEAPRRRDPAAPPPPEK